MRSVFVVAGEASGDLHAANLLRALSEITDIAAFGVGGERLRDTGLECLARSEELSVMGLAEVVRELPRLIRLSRRLRIEAISRRPDVAILVDSPDFNLPMARWLRREGIPVVVYVSPQLWAWRAGRVRRIRRDVARVLTVLPFEVPFYASHCVAAEYVGHPLVDELAPIMSDPPRREDRSLALLPGSRRHEVESLLPTMLDAARRVRGVIPDLVVRLVAAPGMDKELYRRYTGAAEEVELVTGDRHRWLAASSAAVVASGTATLECALLGVPMVVGYRLHGLTYQIARRLVKVPHVALVNLVAGERVVPELVQDAFSAEAVASEVVPLLQDGSRQQTALCEVRRRLGPTGASRRAAEAVVKIMDELGGTPAS